MRSLAQHQFQVSRDSFLLSVNFPNNLWLEVINLAINDIVRSKILRERNFRIKETDEERESSALRFLFDEDHRFFLDDYFVISYCPYCGKEQEILLMKLFISYNKKKCTSCKKLIERKKIKFKIKEEQEEKEISLENLLFLLGINNVTAFRKGCKKLILERYEKKKASLDKQKS